MEQAVFTGIQAKKNNQFHGLIRFADGKTMPIPVGTQLDLSYNGQTCEVERKGGQIVLIALAGKIVYEKSKAAVAVSSRSGMAPAGGRNQERSGSNPIWRSDNRFPPKPRGRQPEPISQAPRHPAIAPYNFVPLNRTVIPGTMPLKFDQYHEERLSGYIDCALTTLTPLYIRDTLNPEEAERDLKAKDISDFFSPGGRIRIPGSSLRGMVRNLVEIVTWSKFLNFDNRLLFYRGMADQSNLRDEYRNHMSGERAPGDPPVYNFKAGYLRREGLRYYILPAQIVNGKTFEQVTKRNFQEEFKVERQTNGKYLVISGRMPNKKHDWLVNPPMADNEGNRLYLCDKDIEGYCHDDNRKEEANLFAQLHAPTNIVPCFYVQWTDGQGRERISFGHTGYFRLAYHKTIGDHVPGILRQEETLDMTEAIFGKVGEFATRVFFEDALLEEGQDDILLPEISPKILSNPKPTTFQHYLEQPRGAGRKQLNHWNSDGPIRGYKTYWHRNNPQWHEERAIQDTQHTIIRAVREGVKFTFRIRFDDLTREELGALLFALELPDNCRHKLGMGKPLGLGSVKITPHLFIIDRKKRYGSLFNGSGWELAEEPVATNGLKKNFEDYILGQIDKEERGVADSLWEVPRLKELRTMLNWNNTIKPDWLNRTRYMEINEFRERNVLPRPAEVVEE